MQRIAIAYTTAFKRNTVKWNWLKEPIAFTGDLRVLKVGRGAIPVFYWYVYKPVTVSSVIENKQTNKQTNKM